MVLIYDNSNPIMGSLLSAARTAAEFNYGQARVPPHRGPCLPASTLPSCLREFGGPAEGCSQCGGRGGAVAGPVWDDCWLAMGTVQGQAAVCILHTATGTEVEHLGIAGGRAAQGPAGRRMERQ